MFYFEEPTHERGTMHIRILLLLLAPTLAAGCGKSLPDMAPVSGVVRFDGKPVGPGKIVFYPKSGRAALGAIDGQGRYRLTTYSDGDGATLGSHRVTISVTQAAGGPSPESFEMELQAAPSPTESRGAGKVTWIVPQEYSQKEATPLYEDVRPGNNEINFNLTP